MHIKSINILNPYISRVQNLSNNLAKLTLIAKKLNLCNFKYLYNYKKNKDYKEI